MNPVRPGGEVRTLIDLFEFTEGRGTQPFFSYLDDLDQAPSETLTYGELHNKAMTVAANLQRHGIVTGDRVGLVALPRADYVAAFAGVVMAGAIPAPINHHFKVRELSAYLSILDPALVVVDALTDASVEQAVKELVSRPEVAGISGASVGSIDLFASCRTSKYVRPQIEPRSPGLILHSSGTTGFPKAVVRTHETVVEFLNWFADYFDDDEHILNFLPLYHQAGLILTFLAAVRIGCDLVQQSRYSTPAFWNLVDENRTTHMNLMAPVPSYLLAQPPVASDRSHTLRWVVIAGRNDHWADFQDRFGIVGMTFYGSTETLQITSTGSPKNGPVERALLASVGHGIMTGQPIGERTGFRLVDDRGAPFGDPGREGGIQARGDFMFTEYLHDPDATHAAFTPDGWFRTGDVGYTTSAGALVLVGRSGGMIRRSGENIAPKEIEMVLEDHPGIQDAIVVGVPDEMRGQEVLARIVLAPGATLSAADVFSYLEGQVSDFKVPRYLAFHDNFERTPTFKIKLDKYRGDRSDEKWHDRTTRTTS